MSGLNSAYAIELCLNPALQTEKLDSVLRPRRWDTYELGSRVPARTARAPSAVDVAEARFPGSAVVFDSELWSVLKGEERSGTGVADASRLGTDCVLATELAFKARLQTRIDELNGFQALEFVVLLSTTANAAGMLELRDLAQYLFSTVAERLFSGDQLRPFGSELRARVNDLFRKQTGSPRPP